jgi:DNA-binding transcriptional regulator YiaG
MPRTWKELRSEAVANGRLDESRLAEARVRQLAQVRAHRLAEIREALGMTQVALAERLHVSQSRVSRIERGAIDHTQLETLRAYLEALGGELEVSARFGDERIRIAG